MTTLYELPMIKLINTFLSIPLSRLLLRRLRDGPNISVRKQLKIRPGFTPQEDVSRFRGSRQQQVDANQLPKGHIIGWAPPPGQTAKPGAASASSAAKSKSAKKNEKRKEKRKEKAEETVAKVKDDWEDEDEEDGAAEGASGDGAVAKPKDPAPSDSKGEGEGKRDELADGMKKLSVQ